MSVPPPTQPILPASPVTEPNLSPLSKYSGDPNPCRQFCGEFSFFDKTIKVAIKIADPMSLWRRENSSAQPPSFPLCSPSCPEGCKERTQRAMGIAMFLLWSAWSFHWLLSHQSIKRGGLTVVREIPLSCTRCSYRMAQSGIVSFCTH